MSDVATRIEAGVPRRDSLGAQARLWAIAQPGLTLDFVTDRAAFLALEDDWNSLFDRAGRSHTLFQDFNWLRHWCDTYLADEGADGPSLAVVVGRRDGRVTMIWPLVLEDTFGVRCASWMGDPVSQYGDVLIEDGDDAHGDLAAAWAFMQSAAGADVFELRKIRRDSAVWGFLEQLGAQVTCEEAAPYADLTALGSLDDYKGRFSKKHRRNQRRIRNRLADFGEISFEMLSDGPAYDSAVAEAIAWKRKWLVANGHFAPAFSDDRLQRFFTRVGASSDGRVTCPVSMMKVAGEPVAIEIGVQCADRYVAHIGAFDMAYAKFSPGTLQMVETVGHCIENGVACHDLLAPNSSYKAHWSDESVPVRDYVVTTTPAGRLYVRIYLSHIRPALKRWCGPAYASLKHWAIALWPARPSSKLHE